MSETKDWSAELHYIAGLCELAASGIGGVDWEQCSKDLREAAGDFERKDAALREIVGMHANFSDAPEWVRARAALGKRTPQANAGIATCGKETT